MPRRSYYPSLLYISYNTMVIITMMKIKIIIIRNTS